MQLKVAILLSFLSCLASADPVEDRAGGLFGLGLLPIGGETTTAAATSTEAASTEATTTAVPETTTAAAPETTTSAAQPVDVIGNLIGGILGGGATTTAAPTTAAPSNEAIQNLLNLLTGVTTILPVQDIANLLGINTTPIPNPLTNPLQFMTHPLITPIVEAATTFNLPALALAQGALAGNLIINALLGLQTAG